MQQQAAPDALNNHIRCKFCWHKSFSKTIEQNVSHECHERDVEVGCVEVLPRCRPFSSISFRLRNETKYNRYCKIKEHYWYVLLPNIAIKLNSPLRLLREALQQVCLPRLPAQTHQPEFYSILCLKEDTKEQLSFWTRTYYWPINKCII